MNYQHYTPAAYKLIRIHTIIAVIATMAVSIGIGFIAKHFLTPHSLPYKIVFAIIIGLALLTILSTIAEYFLATPRYRYLITNDKIECISGYFFIKRRILPLKRLQKVETVSGPIAQHFKLTTMTLTSAGGTLDIEHLPTEVAEPLAERLKNRLNELLEEDTAQVVEHEF